MFSAPVFLKSIIFSMLYVLVLLRQLQELRQATCFSANATALEERFGSITPHVGYLMIYARFPLLCLAQFFRPNSQYVGANVSKVRTPPTLLVFTGFMKYGCSSVLTQMYWQVHSWTEFRLWFENVVDSSIIMVYFAVAWTHLIFHDLRKEVIRPETNHLF
jgi:hypothetical protein